MKFRRPHTPLLLLLVPFASALSPAAQDNKQSSLTNKAEPRDPAGRIDPLPTPLIDPAKAKYDVGTKDAPVDGKDGKPHAGPWVDTPAKDDKSKTGTKAKEAPLKSLEGVADLIAPGGGPIPQSNDGVMDDSNRQVPEKGTTGTTGGVSEKAKAIKAQEGQTGEKLKKKPESPKEAPPLPHSKQAKLQSEKTKVEKTKAKDGDHDADDTADGVVGLEKPNDLPDKPNNLPHPLPNSANKDHLDVTKPGSKGASGKTTKEEEEAEGLIRPFHSYILSLTMILFSEIGDKTFLIAALMAMKHDRMLVFSAALSALFAMTVLSAVLGHAVPTLIPKKFTNFLASGLFLVFGARLMREGLAMSPNEGVGAEMQEVEMELEEKEQQIREQGRRRSSVSPYVLESGLGPRHSRRKSRSNSRLPSPPRSPSLSPDRSLSPQPSTIKGVLLGLNNLLSLLLSPAWVQTFVMTFLGEWGDRSQIATIAMAAGQDYWWVTGGAISGHAVCTGVAVIGGRAIAGKVSLRVVTLGGAIAFLLFGVIYLLEALYHG